MIQALDAAYCLKLAQPQRSVGQCPDNILLSETLAKEQPAIVWRSAFMVYITRVWGADDIAGPLVFGLEGWRDRASRMLRNGDLVIRVGTIDTGTAPDHRNRVLGMMEPITIAANTGDFPLPWL